MDYFIFFFFFFFVDRIENDFDMQMEVLDENEWLSKMEQMKRGGEQEMIIKRNYSRVDQQTLSDMAYQLGLYL